MIINYYLQLELRSMKCATLNTLTDSVPRSVRNLSRYVYDTL